MGPFVTTGNSTVAARVELHQFVKNTKQFSLYVQAVAQMQASEDPLPTSHFSVGGIHGLPYDRWTGDSTSEQLVNPNEGYCTHGMNLFPTWHRPYVLLYEQAIQSYATDIAKKYTVDQQAWADAASAFRLPYWDWANPDTSVPPAPWIGGKKVTITGFDGKETEINNPLLGYHFKTPFTIPTRRGPVKVSNTTRSGNNDPKRFTRSFSGANADQFQYSVKKLFETKGLTWNDFSNHGVATSEDNYVANSLEGIHDTIHGTVGGFMGDPSIAGFDPIFFLHHANVDRLLAIWQTLHSDIWVSTGDARAGTFVIQGGRGATVDETTGLGPFFKSESTLYNSDDVKDWRVLGYDYDDFLAPGINRDDPESVKKGIEKRISQLYGINDAGIRNNLPQDNPVVMRTVRGAVNDEEVDSVLDRLASALVGHRTIKPSDSEVFSPHRLDYYEWTARVRVNQYAAHESLAISFYLDPATDNSSEDEDGPSYVGAFRTFVNSSREACENCRTSGDPMVEGYVYLNKKIAERSDVGSFGPDKILPWLNSHLAWKVEKASGEVVPLEELPSLEVTLVCTRVELQAGATIPSEGELYKYPAVNAGL